MASDSLLTWSLKKALRVLAGLVLLFAAFVMIGLLTRASFSPEHADFPGRAVLYWLITLPLAVLYLVVAISSESMRRRSRENSGQ
jgi:hypothetical protein